MGSSAPFRVNSSNALWFLTALTIVELLAYIVRKFFENKKYMRIFICLLSISLAYLCSYFKTNTYLPWNIDVAFFLYPFFELGALTKELFIKLKGSGNKLYFAIIGIALMVLIVFLAPINSEYIVNIFRCNYGNSLLLYYLTSLLGSLGIILLSMAIEKIKLFASLKYIGKKSLIIMIVHQFLITSFDLLYIKLNIPYLIPYQNFIFTFFAVTISSIIASYIINRWFPFLVGKRNSNKFIM